MKIILIGGGTGGHLFPAVAVAEKLNSKLTSQDDSITLITDQRCVGYLSHHKSKNFNVVMLNSIRPRHSSIFRIPIFCLQNIKVIYQLLKLYTKIKPDVIIGFGGYTSFFPLLVGLLLHIPIMLHEQNSHIGKVNKFFARFAKKFFLSFKKTLNISSATDSRCNKVIVTGNPVRQEIIDEKKNIINFHDPLFRIVITGGSQGAKFFNAIMPQTIALISKVYSDKMHISHQASELDVDDLRNKYQLLHMANINAETDAQNNILIETSSFFDDMVSRLGKAHLVITRAGASTIAELITLEKPSILIPLPSASDNHQYHNAQIIDHIGGGICIQQKNITAEVLSELILARIQDRQILINESINLKMLQNDAAHDISNIVLDFCELRT